MENDKTSNLFLKNGKCESYFNKRRKDFESAVKGQKSLGDKIKAVSGKIDWSKEFVVTEAPRIEKNKEKALKLKEEGNALFKANQMAEAREKYTEAICAFPVDWDNLDKNEEFAVLVANRSATTDDHGTFLACVQDTDLALQCGYPRHLQHKIYQRRGHALLKTKQYISSKEAFKKCLDLIGKSDMPSKLRDQQRTRTEKHMRIFNVNKKIANQDTSPPKLDIKTSNKKAENGSNGPKTVEIEDENTNGENINNKKELWPERVERERKEAENGKEEVPQVIPEKSDYEVHYAIDVNSGKAEDKVEAGEIIMHEAAAVTVVADETPENKICSQSLAKIISPLPCTRGTNVLFASLEDRTEAEKSFHKYEWRINHLLRPHGISQFGRLALRIITKDIKGVLDLPLDDVTAEEELSAIFLSSILAKWLKASDYKEAENIPDKLYKAALIASRYATSMCYTRLPKKMEEWLDMSKIPTFPFGLGIFPNYAKMRHTGRAIRVKKGVKVFDSDDLFNAFSFVRVNKLVVQTNVLIEAGSEVVVESQSELPGAFNKAAEMITFKCANAKCKAGFPLKENTKEKLINCPMAGCGKQTNIFLKLTKIQQLKDSHQKLRQELDKLKEYTKENVKQTLLGYKQLLEEWNSIVVRPYKDVTQLEKELRFIMLYMHYQEESTYRRDTSTQ